MTLVVLTVNYLILHCLIGKKQSLITTLTELLFPYIQLELLAPQHYAQQEFKQLLSMIQDVDVFLSLEQMSQEVQLSRYANSAI